MLAFEKCMFYSAIWSCNLNCVGCSAFSDITSSRDIRTLEEVRDELEPWSKKLFPKHFCLLGGEHFIYPDFVELVKIVCELFPQATHRIETNGIALADVPNAYLDVCRKYNVGLQVNWKPHMTTFRDNRSYPIEKIKDGWRRCEMHGVRIYSGKTIDYWNVYTMSNGQVILPDSNPNDTFGQTGCIACRRAGGQIYNGKFYVCCMLAIRQHAIDIGVISKDKKLFYTPLNPMDSKQRILEGLYITAPLEDCRECPI